MSDSEPMNRWDRSLGDVAPVCEKALTVGVLVVHYNRWELALRALEAAIRLDEGHIAEFVLFDDGSTIPPPERIDSRIRLMRGGRNRGFGGALPVAFAAMTSDLVVLFDSDAVPLTPFAEKVREHFAQDARLGQLGFCAQDEHGAPSESFLNEPTQWSLILGQAMYERLRRKQVRADKLCVITGCMATRLAAYNHVGGFDSAFDFLDVDIEYSMRLRRAGWRVAVAPALAAYHVGGSAPLAMLHRVLHYYKGRWRLLRKHGLMTSPRLARALILARLQCERAILHLFGRWLFPNAVVREDKIQSRKELLAYCRVHFR